MIILIATYRKPLEKIKDDFPANLQYTEFKKAYLCHNWDQERNMCIYLKEQTEKPHTILSSLVQSLEYA